MTLHNDLIEQAHHLALRDGTRPRQASLRRAVSAAYYALFHFLLDQGGRLMFPKNLPNLRLRAIRSFNHGEMRKVCERFAKSTGIKDLTTNPLEIDLIDIATIFVDLQEARHRADYDLTENFGRVQVLGYVNQARQAVTKWTAVKEFPNARVFLVALSLHNRWNK